ncbi:hypothetical protein Mgra_00005399, partial [Meloidogyne graminicola]
KNDTYLKNAKKLCHFKLYIKMNSLGRGIDLRRLPYRFIPFYSSSNNLINNGQRFRRSQPLLPPLIVDQITNDDFNLEPFIISTWEDGKKKRKR